MSDDVLLVLAMVLLMLIVGFALIYLYMMWKQKQSDTNSPKQSQASATGATTSAKTKGNYTKLSIEGFMDFDKIEDNMIVQNNGKRFLMVVECEGINYDLMSGVEKTAVESGFVQFLNTLRHPIQLYTQTRTIDITQSIETYKQKVDILKNDLEIKQREYNEAVKNDSSNTKRLSELKIELVRIQNQYDYGIDIIKNIEKTSQNKNVLRKHYFVVIPYYVVESTVELLNEEERRNMIFSELYTRAQAVIRTLFACSIKSRILNSTELAELLYVAYNREDSEVFGIDKAIRAGYDEMYTTAPNVLDKRMKELDKEIQEKAQKMAEEAVVKVKAEKQKMLQEKEENLEDLIKQLATQIVTENKMYIGTDVAKGAVEEINGENKKEGEASNEEKPKKRTRRTSKPAN